MVLLVGGAYFYSNHDAKYCDTQNIDRSYSGGFLCYEKPAQSLEYIDKNAGKIKPIKMEIKK